MNTVNKIDFCKDNYENGPITIVTDFDEVLCNISVKWVRKLFINKNVFKDYFSYDPKFNIEKNIYNRDEYYLNKWLLKDKNKPLPDNLFEKFMGLYADKGFYDNLIPTNIALSLSTFSKSELCKKIYVVSQCLDSHVDGKMRFLIRLFGNTNKVELVPMKSGEKKSSYIKDIDYNTYIEDLPDNILDVIMNTNSDNNDFIIPKLGYNYKDDFKEALSMLQRKRYFEIYYYTA